MRDSARLDGSPFDQDPVAEVWGANSTVPACGLSRSDPAHRAHTSSEADVELMLVTAADLGAWAVTQRHSSNPLAEGKDRESIAGLRASMGTCARSASNIRSRPRLLSHRFRR